MRTQPVFATEDLAPVEALYDRGLFLQAFQAAGTLGPLDQWRGTPGRLLAGRLARHLGADKLGNRQVLRAWRHDPSDWRARCYFLWAYAGFRGPAALWRRLNQFGDPPETNLKARSDVYSLRARAATMFRDFERADHWYGEAERTGLDAAWLAAERSHRLEMEDRYEDSLVVAQQGLAQRPGNWLLLDRVSRSLQLLGRDDEALSLLRSSFPQNESAYLAATLYAMEFELRHYEDALRTLGWVEERAPLADTDYSKWISANRATCLYYLGRRAEAASWSRQIADDEFSKQFAERLDSPPADASRLELPVGFVRQHHLTCAPATLTTLGRFWGKRPEHLEIAEAICYDGTPGHSQRNWATSNGWIAREFTVTLAAARALLDRGVPFVLATVNPGNSHAQAVIGYDDFRESLLIRDPYFRNKSEFLAGAALAQQASSGPHGMAMVPLEKAELLDGLDLPDAALYDLHHQVLSALDRYDRAAAVAARQELDALAPGHRITLQTRRSIAAYDANSHDQLATLEELLKLYPEDVNLQLSRLQVMRALSRRDERLTLLRTICAKKKSDPLLWQELAGELAQDARQHPAALRLLGRVERFRQADAAALLIRANIEWAQGRFEEACDNYRFAASLNDKSEYYAATWFRASRWLKQTNEAISFLTRCFRRDVKLSSQPAKTLVWAYMQLDQTMEALSILEQTLAQRPNDGDLKLFACEQYTNSGRLQRAEALLEQARGQTGEGSWARAAAAIANQRSEFKRALELWREVVTAEPLAMDAHRSITHLLSETAGRADALSSLEEACERFPFYVPLHELRVTWLRETPAEHEQATRALLDHHPENAWVRRELAIALLEQDRFEEAHRELDIAGQLEPNEPAYFNILGRCFARQGRAAEARSQFSETLRRTVDDVFAMRELLDQCGTPEQRDEALSFIQAELIRQTTFGQGILEFADLARPFLAPEGLLALLQQAQSERPDLWQAWSALISQLVSMKQADEALKLAKFATETFPLVPQLWLDLADVHRARLERSEQIAALEQALQISPNWGYASRQLAEALQASERAAEARTVLEQGIARSPQDPFNRGVLAELLWKLGEKESAVAELRRGVLLEPGYEWAWNQLLEWGGQIGQPKLRLELAEELAQRRPGEARSWWLLANALMEPAELDRRLECLAKAIERNPHFIKAWRSRATALANAGRYEEALAACRPPGMEPVPAELRMTAAWVRAAQGDLPSAIREMRIVLADHPDSEWGWRELASWYYQREEYALAAEAAGALSRLLPFDPAPLGFAADLKLREGDRAGAMRDFGRAFDLDSSYTFAGFKLFDLQIEGKNWNAARQTLQRLRDVVLEPSALEREIFLEIAIGNPDAVMPLLRRMCISTADDPSAFEQVAELLKKHRLVSKAQPVALEALRGTTPNPSVGSLWVELRSMSGKVANSTELLQLPTPSELGKRAFARQLLAIGEKIGEQQIFPWNSPQADFKRMMQKHRDWFYGDAALWGKVAYVFVNQKRYAEAVKWLENWRQREGVEPWMLENLLFALQQLNRHQEVDVLVRSARALPRHLGSFLRFDLFFALNEACAGNAEPGQHLLTLIDEKQLEPYDKSFLAFLRVALHFSSPQTSTVKFDGERRKQLGEALDSLRNYRVARRVFREVTDLIIRRTGKQWVRVWAAIRAQIPLRPAMR